MVSRSQEEAKAAREAVASASASDAEKAEMLMEIAMGMQQKPKSLDDLIEAIKLYDDAVHLCPETEGLLSARIKARMATAQMSVPSNDPGYLEGARDSMNSALEALRIQGTSEEVAEAEMNLGLILQNLASYNRAPITDSISAYQRSLRTFNAQKHPAEFAILQNNLATAFMSIPFSDERSKMREALAVQAFEEGLKVVTIVDNPSEYAMLQNNLGNALQYVSSSHRVENGFRAIEAYDEALRVRTLEDTPAEYANTISNKANCIANLPDDPENPEAGNPENLKEAIRLYREARSVFNKLGDIHKVEAVSGALEELETEMFGSSQPLSNVHKINQ
ncbi:MULTISPECIES: hypothetical protein [unclassified Hyphomonas]|jgi:tetratricopeptide (TPR) repeat protein|uniref:hypothetical protein n=2 Tax=Pseudomonadota TaxID=1224 RepID=UPI000C60498B|nr:MULTISPECIES: hypothetical protein [unclassified Hyphomonas]MBM07807.1 hypothetical protein [Sulfitobacter sp.]MBO6686894.1 hypothetical protein [Henriciella sp.]MAL43285.1 hypothetical protein [Hyphomonas sp.]MBL4878505.1 hypothetical protein [Hyphomonas sp.]MBO6695762.1 hypothetical protein [Henriciella sp.]|tara:strand:+ start:11576 stop:12580 length:1005 start_codon:yes stop_codon:yes gene_type:complete